MVTLLFKDFLRDADEYAACERHWQELVEHTAATLGQTGEWARWIPRTYPNGKPVERDGNPISDGRSHRLNRGFRVIQHEASEDGLELAAWLKTHEEEFADFPRDELVINLGLSVESSAIAARLLSSWMKPTTTRATMEALIAEVFPAKNEDPMS